MTKYKHQRHIDQRTTRATTTSGASGGTPAPVDSTPVNTGTSYPYEPAGSGDCVMLTCFDESGLKPTIWTDNAGKPFNAIKDYLVDQITPATADLVYVAEDELSRMPSVRTLVLWVNWFTRIGASEDLTKVRPGIGYNFKARLVSLGEWNVSTYTPTTAINFPSSPAISGTVDDAAFVEGARYLASRGYQIGLAPVVRFVDTSGTQESSWESWRGTIAWPDLTTLNAWLAEYQSFVLHYLNILLSAGLTPSLFYVGSEFRDLSTTSASNQQAAWITMLQSLASQIKASSSTTKTTYAANYDEYSYVGSDFHLDALWSHPDLDQLGIDWYEPLTLTHTNDPE
jgi:ribulose bisphosphate carboxylase small subunit